MKLKMIGIMVLIALLAFSTVPIVSHAASSPTFTPPSNLKMGTFEPYPGASNYGANATKIGTWVSMSWGVNSAYQTGAVDFPYQFLLGDFYENGQNVAQDIYVNIHLNWSVINSEDLGNGFMGTSVGAPYWGWFNEYQYQFGVGDGADGAKPFKLVLAQGNSTVLSINVTEGSQLQPSTVSFPDPAPIQNGSFYLILFSPMYYPQTVYAGNNSNQFVGYEPIYIGEGEYNALNSHVSGKPTTSVNAGLTGASALLNWTFSGGDWNVTFVHYLNNDPADTSSSNIQVLQYDNFTYKQTGGEVHLRYNFTLNQASGVYAWQFNTQINSESYGQAFLVYNNITVQQSGDRPPMITIQIQSGKQGGSSTVNIIGKDAKNSSISLEISIWFGNDMYTVPNASYENVIYYFAPASIPSGGNYSLTFTNNFYGELNVEVLSENIYGEWNNSYASSVVKASVYSNGSFQFPTPAKSWITSPFSSPLNALLLVAGIGLFLFSVHESGLEGAARRRIMQGLNAPFLDVRTHYLAAVVLFLLAFVNWSLLFATITSWGGLIP